MADIWFISDTHFFHDNILKFLDRSGKQIRPEFTDVNHMNDYMVTMWNERVRPQDKVYHLGDVGVGVKRQNEFTGLIYSLHGHKRLLLGNHDHIRQNAYQAFEKIDLWTGGKFKPYGFVASHIPLRKDQMRDGEFNVHGHTHQNLLAEPWYINVCVEVVNYRPLHLDEILQEIKKRS